MTTDKLVTDHVLLGPHSERLVLRALPTTVCYPATYISIPIVPLSQYYEALPVVNELAAEAPYQCNTLGWHADVSGIGVNCVDSTEPPDRAASQHLHDGTTSRTTSCCRRNWDVDLNDVSNVTGGEVATNSVENDGNVCSNPGNGASNTMDQNGANSISMVMAEKSMVGQVFQELTGKGRNNIRPYPLYCGSCRIHLNAPRQAREHFEGKGHARKLRLTRVSDCDKKLCSNRRPGELANELSSKRQMDVVAKETTRLMTSSVTSCGADIYCRICAVAFNSEKQAIQHYSGKTHLRRLRHGNGLQPISGRSYHTCIVCGYRSVDRSELDEHVHSHGHSLTKSLLDNAQHAMRNNAVVDEDDFPTAVTLRQANANYGQSELKFDNDGIPLPSPAVRTKEQVFQLSDFKRLDEKACQVSPSLISQPLDHLVRYLISGTKTELERVRVIYRWITAQNLAELSAVRGSRTSPSSGLDYLIGIKHQTSSYHKLMTDMCSIAGIVTKAISGYTKHSKYEIGALLTDTECSSTWTAVLIDRIWYLVDVNWSSKHVTGSESGEWKLLDDNGKISENPKNDTVKGVHYQYDENYFLTNPEELIYSHFPTDGRWQLLSRRINAEEFQKMAYLKPHFFQCGLRLMSHTRCVIEAPDGLVTVQLGYETSCKFMYRLWISSKGAEQTMSHMFKGVSLTRFVFLQNRDGRMTCDLRFPIAGKFKLDLFSTSDALASYNLVCCYVINAPKAAQNPRPFPENNRSEWGPGKDLEDMGMTPLTHTGGLIESKNGEVEIRFKADEAVDVLTKLHSDTRTDDDLSRFVIYYVVEDEVVINVRMPEEDEYVLKMYARRENDSNTTLSSVCSYLISSSQPASDTRPFPISKLGAQKNSSFEIKPITHPSALVTAPDDGSQMNITFKVSKHCELLPKLKYYREGVVEEDMSGYTVVSETTSDTTTVSTRFSETGIYILNIFARSSKPTTGNSFAFAFRYMIQVNHATVPCHKFPKQYTTWTSECRLVEPDISQPIEADSTICFRVNIPGAFAVSVVGLDRNGKDAWTTLKQIGKLWTGEVKTGKAGDPLNLYAKFQANATSFSCLLEFEVVPKSERIQRTTTIHEQDECDAEITEVPSPYTKVPPIRSSETPPAHKSELIIDKKLPAIDKSDVQLRKKKKRIKHKRWRNTAPAETRVAKPKPVEEETEIKERWKREFLMREEKKQLGEKEFRIKIAKQKASKLAELELSIKKRRSVRIET